MSTSISLSGASPLEPAQDLGRLGRISRRCARWCAEYLPFSRTWERGGCSCACGLCCGPCAVAACGAMVACGTSDARPRQP
eukprot:4338895-Prymnesium_polylepis.1